MKKTITVTAFLLLLSCTVGSDTKDGLKFNLTGSASGRKISLAFERGKDYWHLKSFGAVKVRIRPQLAVWFEDTNGAYLKTVFVTRCFGKQKWKAKTKPDVCFRPMCMPYWLNRFKAAGNSAPTPAAPLPDGVTGATAPGSFTIDFSLPDSLSTVVLCAEWNSSFDNNDYFTPKKSSFNGQPSVVASARIDLGDSTIKKYTLSIKGYGGSNGDDPELYSDIDKLTTAKTIFGSIIAEVQP